MSKQSTKPVPAHVVALLDGPATASAIGATQAQMRAALAAGQVKVKTKQGKQVTVKQTDENGKATRGRPSRVYMLTDAGRKRAKRAREANTTAASASVEVNSTSADSQPQVAA